MQEKEPETQSKRNGDLTDERERHPSPDHAVEKEPDPRGLSKHIVPCESHIA